MKYDIEIDGTTLTVDVQQTRDGRFRVIVDDGEPQLLTAKQLGAAEWSLDRGDGPRTVGAFVSGDHASLVVDGHPIAVTITDPRDKALAMGGRGGAGAVGTPMPGVIVRVPVQVGQVISAGAVVVVVEAMKMENDFKSPIDGIVQAIHVAPGQAVEANTLLVTVAPEA